ncbi:MAG: hypothetical protein JWO76_2795 [Nocardioides sp.]|nr:hypothetical protein [Nocardioides sp.]
MTRLPFVRRALAAAVVAPLAVASLAACGGDDGTAADPASSASTSSSSSSSPSDAPTSEAPEAGSDVDPAELTAKFATAFENTTTAHAEVTSELMGGALNGKGDLDYTGDSPAASMVMTGDAFNGEEAETRLVDGIMYMKLGSFTDNKFAKIDLSDPNNPLGTLGDTVDPKAALDKIGAAMTKATYVGEEDVDGQAMQHYTASVDMAKVLEGMGQDGATSGTQIPKSMEYDVWFDGEGRLAKMVVDMAKLGTTTTTLTDFGTDVSIEAPPASEITKSSPFTTAG